MGFFDLVYESELSHRARVVLIYLKDHADREGKCWPGIGTIARELGMSRSTVKRGLGELEQAGVVVREGRRKENGGYTSNLYRIAG